MSNLNYTLRDAAMSYDYPTVAESGKNEKYKQRLEFRSEQLPELVGWQPGEEYILVIKVKETTHEVKMLEGESKECAYFDVLEVGAVKDPYVADIAAEVAKKLKLK